MRVTLNQNLCIGCGLCEENVPSVFQMNGVTAELKVSAVPADLQDSVYDAAEDCPVEAISIDPET